MNHTAANGSTRRRATRARAHTHTHTHTYTHIDTHSQHVHIHTYPYTHTNTHTHTPIYTHTLTNRKFSFPHTFLWMNACRAMYHSNNPVTEYVPLLQKRQRKRENVCVNACNDCEETGRSRMCYVCVGEKHYNVDGPLTHTYSQNVTSYTHINHVVLQHHTSYHSSHLTSLLPHTQIGPVLKRHESST